MNDGAPGNRRFLALSLIGIAGYGFMNWLSSLHFLPGCSFAELRPQVCLPMWLGLFYSPWVGMIAGAGGDFFGYFLTGWSPMRFWQWSVANGLMGFLAGWAGRTADGHWRNLRELQRLYLALFLATSLPYVFSVGVTAMREDMTMSAAVFQLFLPVFITDFIFAIALLPGILLMNRRIVRTLQTVTALSMTNLMLLAVLATSGVAIATSILITPEPGGKAASFTPLELYTLGIFAVGVIILGLGMAAVTVKRLTAPLVSLTRAADDAAAEHYEELERLSPLAGAQDEIGRLVTAFTAMLGKVREREDRLKAEVRQLHIEIDRARQKREVERITHSDYFRELKQKARALREGPPE